MAIDVGDFFRLTPTRDVTALVGNQPYVRYQTHAGEDCTASREAALRTADPVSASSRARQEHTDGRPLPRRLCGEACDLDARFAPPLEHTTA
jgi:hypothetical protein